MVSNTAIIIIVLVASLGSVSLAAAFFGSIIDNDYVVRMDPSMEQRQYMRDARLRNLLRLEAEFKPRPWRPKSNLVDIENENQSTMSEDMEE
ncbi:uncharacterized protein N7483_002895 [Penicillium malachiteum]|uniref:uncharacterized protein n=1 Tax=Penicillium malachiteum TaxID=1324776 RepID=UPI002547D72B|nr:uncharacterized protein N7483_002895 [Penicillium malachiteum]KAJ5737770.1 hypothetical protein N7483_002895 [Penicillium malachiteum]